MEGLTNDCKDFVNKCCLRNPTERIGYKGPRDIMNHSWFKSVKWDELREFKIVSPILEFAQGNESKENFDLPDLTIEEIERSKFVLNNLSVQEMFKDYIYPK